MFRDEPTHWDASGASMTTRKDDGRATPGRARGEDGAALLEFALVAILLFTLIFGIISYGFMLSFKQDMTRSAAEGARAGAVAFPVSEALTAAQEATMDAAERTGKSCTTTDGVDSYGDGLTCSVSVAGCTTSAGDCVYVELEYDQDGHPIVGHIPLLDELPPNTLTSKSVARVNS
jgi:Flp pilus assembly protein TadG